MSANLNTAAALAQLNALVRDTALEPDERGLLIGVFEQLLGIDLSGEPRRSGFSTAEDGEIGTLVVERDDARRRKDWARADEIRDELIERGVVLEDRIEGTSWRRA